MLEELDRLLDGSSPGTSGEDGVRCALHPLNEALLSGSGPREALLNLRKLVVVAPEADWPIGGKALGALASILSSGPELTRLLVRDPRRLALLSDPRLGQAWSPPELAQDLDARLEPCAAPEELARAITAFRNDHYLRLAACEFGLSTLEQVGLELSNLADLCLDRTISFCLAHQGRIHGEPLMEEQGQRRPCPLTAIAMGKYGAQELNFCSDIDLIFIYESDEGQAGALSLNEFFARVCQQVTRLLSEPNDEGLSFRVDLRLRPEGSRGPICNSLGGAERYYETWGGPYDRLAWLKARAAAGDLEIGEQMLQLLRPFVFPRSLQPDVIGQIQELDRRIKAQQRQVAAPGWNVKLDRGGIRGVEFFVQALQLLHAGKQPALQQRGTIAALDRLLFAGLITEQEHRQLGEAYELWRRIEHRLQLVDGRQTHQLPPPGDARERVALHLGYPPREFEQAVARHQEQVDQIYRTLGPPENEPEGLETDQGGAPTEGAALLPLLDPDLPEELARVILEEAGVSQSHRAAEQLQALTSKPWGPLGRARAAESPAFALALLVELFASPDPDAALHHITALTLRLGPLDGLWSLLEEHRPTLRLLCSLLGSSDYLARLLIRSPELLDSLLLGRRGDGRTDPQTLGAELTRRLEQVPVDDLEAQLHAMHRFREEEVLRIGTQDIAGELALEEVWSQLSHLAVSILQQIYPAILQEMISRYGTPRQQDGEPATMVVLGLGKLGAMELTYGSDLDLIFIFSERGATDGERSIDNGEFFTRLAQRIIRLLSMTLEQGSLYQVDTRLRPSGQQGTLVSSWAAFREYHQAAQIWERQVLIKANPVAGDLQLGARIQTWLSDFIYAEQGTRSEVGQEIHRLRCRIEEELAGEKSDFHNLKLGRGGLLDIEFIVQFYQMTRGGETSSLKAPSTLAALAALGREALIPAETADALSKGYRFLRRIEGRLRIVRDRSAEHLPATAEGLEVMARRLGYRRSREASAGQQLLQEYQARTEEIRAIYRGVFPFPLESA